MDVTFTLVTAFIGLLLLNVAAWYWAADSRDSWDSSEWEHRRRWRQRDDT